MAESNTITLAPQAKDERGNRYGRLAVIEPAEIRGGQVVWLCQCDCGNTSRVMGSNLRRGTTTSCGCFAKEKTKAGALSPWAKDERGNVYGKLTVLDVAEVRGEVIWLCQCECGNTAKVAGGDLRKGGTKSCGCGRMTQGGGCGTPEYTTWREMKRRCYRESDREYHNYGGRGIEICDRWRNSFTNFIEDMGKKPFDNATIDRIDNDGNYEPGNCRWATKMEQGANTRKARLVTHNGITDTLRGWGRRLGLQHCTIKNRLNRGWPLDRVLCPTNKADIVTKKAMPSV